MACPAAVGWRRWVRGRSSTEWPVIVAVIVTVVFTGCAPSPSSTGRPAAPPAWMRRLAPGEKPPQFVLFSFDGVGSHEHWRRILPIADRVHAHFTGFLSGVYLLQ